MCALSLVLILAGCMGFQGGAIPDTGRDDSREPGDTQPPPDETPAWLGTGADGALELSARFVLDISTREGREYPDGVHYPVQSISGATVQLGEDAEGLEAGDEAILINLQGSATAYTTVGAWTFVELAAVDGASVELTDEPGVTFAETGNETLEGQAVVLQRVPQYTSVTLLDGATLTIANWAISGGGVLVLRARDGLHVHSGATIDLTGMGYAGGATGSAGCDGYQGESITGWGIGGGCGGRYNEDIGAQYPNLGGGGCIITGGGGGHGGYGLPGEPWNSGYSAPSGGEPYGDEALSALHLGSGGGGVWNGSDGTEGPGGAGGGIVLLAAAAITVDEGGTIQASGADTSAWSTGSYTYGAGGGAGGSVWLMALELSLAEASVLAAGGAGEASHERYGGDGAQGRVRVDCQLCNGAELGSAAASEALNLACEPDPGWGETPE